MSKGGKSSFAFFTVLCTPSLLLASESGGVGAIDYVFWALYHKHNLLSCSSQKQQSRSDYFTERIWAHLIRFTCLQHCRTISYQDAWRNRRKRTVVRYLIGHPLIFIILDSNVAEVYEPSSYQCL